MRALQAIRLIAGREINERIRTCVFLVTTAILGLALVAAIVFVPRIFEDDEPGLFRVGVVGEFATAIEQTLQDSAQRSGLLLTTTQPADSAVGERAVLDESLDALVVDATEAVVRESIPGWQRSILSAAVEEVRLIADLQNSGLSAEVATLVLSSDRSLSVRALIAPEEEATSSNADDFLGLIGVVLMYMAIIVYGQMVMTGVIQEKSSRVVELLLATVRPQHLLAGKVFGIGLVGLAQMILLGVLATATAIATDLPGVPAISARAWAAVLLWFILGYTFYSAIYAAAGSAVSRLEDAQSAVGPVVVVASVSYVLSIIAVQGFGPDGLQQVASIAAILPPVAPFAMSAKMILGTAETWEIIVSVALMLAATYGTIRLGARLYHGSVLQTGPRVRWRDAWRRGRSERVL